MAHGKVITAAVCSCRKAAGNLRKTGVYHDGRDVPLGQGRLNGAASAGAKLVWSGSDRLMKPENAENQRARIAPGLDRHGIFWSGCRDWLRGSVASGPMVRSEMPKGRSSMAGFVCLPCGNVVALGVRCVLGQPRAADACSGQRGPSGVWSVRSVAFGDAGGSGVGWLAGLVWRWIKTVIPGEAQRRPGIHTRLEETGFPPSRE